MSRIHRPAAPAEAGLGPALTQATRACQNAALRHAGQGHALDLATVRDESWQLIHLLGALSDLTTAHVADVGRHPHHQLRSDDGDDPGRHVAHACRAWTDLRRALDNAQHACRKVYTALSHLNVQRQPENDTWPRG